MQSLNKQTCDGWRTQQWPAMTIQFDSIQKCRWMACAATEHMHNVCTKQHAWQNITFEVNQFYELLHFDFSIPNLCAINFDMHWHFSHFNKNKNKENKAGFKSKEQTRRCCDSETAAHTHWMHHHHFCSPAAHHQSVSRWKQTLLLLLLLHSAHKWRIWTEFISRNGIGTGARAFADRWTICAPVARFELQQ